MVNGTLMAKSGLDQVAESARLEAVAGTGARMRGRKAQFYCDFALLGAKPGEFPLFPFDGRFTRGTTANQRYLGDPQRLGFPSTLGMARSWERGW